MADSAEWRQLGVAGSDADDVNLFVPRMSLFAVDKGGVIPKTITCMVFTPEYEVRHTCVVDSYDPNRTFFFFVAATWPPHLRSLSR